MVKKQSSPLRDRSNLWIVVAIYGGRECPRERPAASENFSVLTLKISQTTIVGVPRYPVFCVRVVIVKSYQDPNMWPLPLRYFYVKKQIF